MAESTTASNILALVQDGRVALMAGDTYTARQHFRQALEIDPEYVDALIGMAGTMRAYREKREHLLRALSIEPSNAEARAILAQVESHIAAGEVLAPGGVQVREPERGLSAAAPPRAEVDSAPAQTGTLYCYNHPKRETGLRCTNCDRPICAECMRQAAVGQLCPECARSRRPVNYQVSAGSLALSAGIALAYGLLASILAGFAFGLIHLGFLGLFLAMILGSTAGELLVRLLERVNRKRGRSVQVAVGICYGVAAAPVALFFFGLSLVIFTVAALTTAITRLR
jgi:tetratricopeptide (TPR) repeat protein